MDFLGAMFEGIGKTFEAGAAVDTAKINAETLRNQNDFNRDALELTNQQFQAGAVLATNNAQRNMILAIMGIITAVIIISIFKRK